jgi:hypothetical protein
LLPKRTFTHIPAKITLLLAGGAIAWTSFAGAPASGAHQPGDPARADQPAKRPRPDRRHGHRRHGRRHHGRRHHRSRRLRHRQHHRRHHRHVKRHRIHRLPRRPQRIAWSLLATFHWAHRQFRYLELLWNRESGWNRFACNPYSGAYGIPQALPASKMASAGPDYRTNARTQILWGMRYIRGAYVTPYRAWLHETHYGWY